LSGNSLTDDPNLPRKWIFSAPSLIPTHGFYRLRCDSLAPPSSSNTAFGLSKGGDRLYLYDKPPMAADCSIPSLSEFSRLI